MMALIANLDPRAPETLLLAMLLTATSPQAAECVMSSQIRYAELASRPGFESHGKYFKFRDGSFAQIRADAAGRHMSQLPADVDPANVIDIGGESVRPLQDRLTALKEELEAAGASAGDGLAAMARGALEACSEEYVLSANREVTERALSLSQPLLAGEPDRSIREQDDFVRWLGVRATEMRNAIVADGTLAGTLLGLQFVLIGARNETGMEALDIVSLSGFVGFIGALPPTLHQHLLHATCEHAISKGKAAMLRTAAEHLKDAGDQGIELALDGPSEMFHITLYRAAPLQVAARSIARTLHQSASDEAERRRLARFAMNAEERMLRIEGSLRVALTSIHRDVLATHREEVEQLRRNKGERAARQQALDLVENQLLYPRAMLPAFGLA